MSAQQLKGAELWEAVSTVLGQQTFAQAGGIKAHDGHWSTQDHWSLVPDMLEWLRRGNQRITAITINRYGWSWVSSTHWADPNAAQETDADLPTALARLVVKVAEAQR